jgi:hypothetical protein
MLTIFAIFANILPTHTPLGEKQMASLKEIENYIDGSIEAARDCASRGNLVAAQRHYETADAFAKEASIIRIKSGRGI